MPWSYSSPVMEAFIPYLGSILPLPWSYPSFAMEAFFPCNIRKSYGFPQASTMAFPKNQSAEGAKRPIALDVFRSFGLRPLAGRVRGKPHAAHDHANGFRRFSKGRHRKQYCPSDLPLRSIPPTALRLWAPPAYGRGWPGSFRTIPLTAHA